MTKTRFRFAHRLSARFAAPICLFALMGLVWLASCSHRSVDTPRHETTAAYPAPVPAEEVLVQGSARQRRGPAPAAAVQPGKLLALGYSIEPELDAFDTEEYDVIDEAGFRSPYDAPRSTFSIDVDTASYANVRRMLQEGGLPPAGAVRIEEMLNYFRYDDALPEGDEPFGVTTEIAAAPWNPQHQILRVGIRTAEIDARDLPPRNLVFLVDVSGSMSSPDKLELVKQGLEGLARQLRREDRVAVVVYAGASGLVLPPTSGDQRERILDALERLQAGGSTNGASGIRLAYQTAREHFDEEGINRVLLATDGDFNVGTTNRSELVDLIERERESGVFLTVLGVGRGNLKDATMQDLADRGNGNYAYLDSPHEARKVLVEEAGATLVTVAKDVKIQIEFNPTRVGAYRLIGYENRRLADRDFNDDSRDAGEIGAGHSVTALYEIAPPGAAPNDGNLDPLRYQRRDPGETDGALVDEVATLKIRWKEPQGATSALASFTIPASVSDIAGASDDLRFGSAVALFGMLLRGSEFAADADFELVRELARDSLGRDAGGLRSEFLRLAVLADSLSERRAERPQPDGVSRTSYSPR